MVQGGQKAGLGTNALNGKKIGEVTHLKITRHDNYAVYATDAGAHYGPYMNFWIKDSAGNYAVLANEPSNSEWTGTSEWDADWATLQTKVAKIYDNPAFIKPAGTTYTFADFADYEIVSPTSSELAAGWTGMGGGIPRELGSNTAYGFTWVFGDTLGNYVSGNPGYIVSDPIAVPEPATLGLLALGAIGMLRRRRA